MASALLELRERPFELLKELERRSRIAASGRGQESGQQEEWVGVGFRVGRTRFVAARQEVREVLTWPGVTPLPGAKPWLLGLANVRGQLLPITDLAAFFGAEPITIGRGTRVVMVNHPDIPAGLLVDEVRGFRRFIASEKAESLPDSLPAMTPFLAGAYGTDEDVWGVLGLHGLVESTVFLQAAR
ncbi:MAG TPA: chemotaxis protein CheW [Gammaproteobacteria bacterium]|nr:chemotaxis protein CheW [Gammaproteobacteria bacterium]HEV2212464.1 chemotaxis protein CheW [Gammaproteobacteria bacterium]